MVVVWELQRCIDDTVAARLGFRETIENSRVVVWCGGREVGKGFCV